MSSIVSLGLTYCFCTSISSLCTTCFGTTAPNTTGRKRSALLLTLTVLSSLVFQHYIGPNIANHSGWWNWYRSLPGLGRRVHNAFVDGCDRYGEENGALFLQCVGNNAAYRPCWVSTTFFVIAAVASKIQPNVNREAWPAKYAIWFFLLLATLFVPNHPMLDGVFLVTARLGAMLFLVLQQIILIDVAYNWNETWVANADRADQVMGYGSGVGWLRLIVATCVGFYLVAVVALILLWHYFSACGENATVIVFTFLGIVAVTAIQLTGEEGSLLTSSVICLYATYLAFSVVSKNPNANCNPYLGGNDVWNILIGLALTALSLGWTGWSFTAEERLNSTSIQATKAVSPTSSQSPTPTPSTLDLNTPFLDPEDAPPTGVVMETASSTSNSTTTTTPPMDGKDLWKLNIVLALISCWVACMLTGWGSVEGRKDGIDENTAANPQVGRVNMFMIAFSQFLAIALYGWTLLAPRLFPDRDFS